jgi:membrane-associated protease RseP (regulator of RpoE activity)
MGAWVATMPPLAPAQGREIVQILEGSSPLLHSSSQGYLGVDLTDVDQEKAQALKLKEVRGAIITLIDHDAPAGQIGLKVNDVVLKLNGQTVEGAEQLRRMLREVPAGRKISIEISREGNVQTLAVELADRRAMEHDVWNKLGKGGDVFAQAPGMGILPGGGDAPLPPGFHMPFFGSSLNVGALVEPLTSQMAEYLDVPSGLMVKQVARKSEAAAAGMKAFDVILKVGPEAISTLADWDRALRANEGKPVQVTVLRDRKQQTLTLQVDSKHHSELEMEELFPNGECPLVAEMDPEFAEQLSAEALKDQIGAMQFEITPQQEEAFQKQAEKLRESLKGEEFKIDPKQMDQFEKEMKEFQKEFKPEDFKLDPKQLDELKLKTNEFEKAIPQQFNFNLDEKQLKDMMETKTKTIIAPPVLDEGREEMMKRQMDELKRQMEEMKALGFGDHI